MTREELELFTEYIRNMIESAKEDIKEYGDPYWPNRRADEALSKLYELIEEK